MRFIPQHRNYFSSFLAKGCMTLSIEQSLPTRQPALYITVARVINTAAKLCP